MIEIEVKVDTTKFDKIRTEIERGMRLGLMPILKAFRQWAIRYRSAMQERFDKYSKGGGDWPPLKPSTIAGRRHGKGGRFKRGKRALKRAKATGGGQVTILRDTGTLFAALNPTFTNRPGSFEKIIKHGIRVGYGGPAKHPKGVTTIADIAAYHQSGGRKLPRRVILDQAPQKVVNAMADDMIRAVKTVLKEKAGE